MLAAQNDYAALSTTIHAEAAEFRNRAHLSLSARREQLAPHNPTHCALCQHRVSTVSQDASTEHARAWCTSSHSACAACGEQVVAKSERLLYPRDACDARASDATTPGDLWREDACEGGWEDAAEEREVHVFSSRVLQLVERHAAHAKRILHQRDKADEVYVSVLLCCNGQRAKAWCLCVCVRLVCGGLGPLNPKP
jgi:hypothetical protein